MLVAYNAHIAVVVAFAVFVIVMPKRGDRPNTVQMFAAHNCILRALLRIVGAVVFAFVFFAFFFFFVFTLTLFSSLFLISVCHARAMTFPPCDVHNSTFVCMCAAALHAPNCTSAWLRLRSNAFCIARCTQAHTHTHTRLTTHVS